MRVLVDLGADPTLTNEDGTTVLMVASGVGIHSPGEDPGTEAEALACVEIALELGGDPNAVDERGETPLHGAAYRGANSSWTCSSPTAPTPSTRRTSKAGPPCASPGRLPNRDLQGAPHTATLFGGG